MYCANSHELGHRCRRQPCMYFERVKRQERSERHGIKSVSLNAVYCNTEIGQQSTPLSFCSQYSEYSNFPDTSNLTYINY